jgi:hypothetical protein
MVTILLFYSKFALSLLILLFSLQERAGRDMLIEEFVDGIPILEWYYHIKHW